LRDHLQSLRGSFPAHPVYLARRRGMNYVVHFRCSSAICDVTWELFSSRFPFSNKMTTHGINVSAFH
jgi:hypothetical protein